MLCCLTAIRRRLLPCCFAAVLCLLWVSNSVQASEDRLGTTMTVDDFESKPTERSAEFNNPVR